MSNTGKFKDTTPELRAAGLLLKAGNTTTRECIEPDTLRENQAKTPEPIEKFRSNHSNKLGHRRVFHSFFKDDSPAREIRHGLISKMSHGVSLSSCHISVNVSFSAKDTLTPHLKSDLQHILDAQSENIYHSSQNKLGKSRSHGHTNVYGNDRRFGITSVRDESAKELICPPIVKVNPSTARMEHLRYVRSHGDYSPGEQRDRNYDWSNYSKDSQFGCSTKHSNDGKEVQKSLRWKSDDEALRATTLISKRVTDYCDKTRTRLRTVFDPNVDTRHVSQDHAFGVVVPPDQFGTGDLMQNPEGAESDTNNAVGESVAKFLLDVPEGRVFGVPTIRTDIRPPESRSISDHQNYGGEATAKGLVNPSIYSSVGVYEEDVISARSKEEMRSIYNEIGIIISDDVFDTVWTKASQWDPQGRVSVDSFKTCLHQTARV